jgi:hypothetical protein
MNHLVLRITRIRASGAVGRVVGLGASACPAPAAFGPAVVMPREWSAG